MLMSVFSIVFGLCFFIIPMWAYRKGLKDGLAISAGAKTIEPIRTPVQVIEQAKEAKQVKIQDDLIAQGIVNIFSFDGKSQQGGVNHESQWTNR